MFHEHIYLSRELLDMLLEARREKGRLPQQRDKEKKRIKLQALPPLD